MFDSVLLLLKSKYFIEYLYFGCFLQQWQMEDNVSFKNKVGLNLIEFIY